MHPRTVIEAINAGTIDAWRFGDTIVVDEEQAAKSGEVEWIPAWRWARMQHRKITTILGQICTGEIDGVDQGKGRRWVIKSSDGRPVQ